ncbi:EAL domain-containing protein [Sphingomonas sp. PsM26]|nr:EAL domain-containing protein [Sphingomonas sp. PsM26]
MDEEQRLRVLPSYDVPKQQSDADYDRIVELAAEIFDVPICLVTLVGEDSQWLLGRKGFNVSSTPRDIAFCTHTILTDQPLIVPDATGDSRFRDNPLVTGDDHIRFYAGAPLVSRDGVKLGAFCILDRVARADFSTTDLKRLVAFAAIVAERLEKRRLGRTGQIVTMLSEATGVANVTCDDAGRITWWNVAASRLFGFSASEAIGQQLDLIIPSRFQQAHAAGLARLIGGAPSTLNGKRVEVIARRSDGSEFAAELAMSIWQGPTGLEFGAHIHDITDRRQREIQLRHLASHDALTGLVNRGEFRAHVEQCFIDQQPAAVVALDLDGFKKVNDAFGHDAGDALLQMIAVRMIAAAEGGAVLARVGGDEFAMLLPACSDLLQIVSTAQQLLDAFIDAFVIGDHEVTVGASIGIALAPLHATEADELLVCADLALFRAKKQGGRSYCLFNATMASEHTARRAFKDEMRQAFERREWQLHYQPQVRLRDGALIGVEALLRWQHPTRGLLSPAAFMPILETHLVAYEIGCWVLGEACRQLGEWRNQGLTVNRVGVNLFAAQFRAGTLETMVSNTLMTHALQPTDLELEITETIAISHDDDALVPLQNLYNAGVGIALDDFGTGFASLSTLQRFPLTRLKIDRSFVHDIATDPHNAVIVQHVAAIGRGLGLSVIAEGIETIEQERMLLAIGCEEGQGFKYGKAMDGDTMARWIGHPLHGLASGTDRPVLLAGSAL